MMEAVGWWDTGGDDDNNNNYKADHKQDCVKKITKNTCFLFRTQKEKKCEICLTI